MDKEWDQIVDKNSCKATTCVHTEPTRPSHGGNRAEMQLYNMVQSGQLKPNDENYPVCKKYNDYRMTDTEGCRY